MSAIGQASASGPLALIVNRRRARSYWSRHLVALPCLLAFANGCREELGPVSFPTTRVTGRVRQGSLAVVGGWIEFLPIGKTVGNLRSAPIAADGTFEATRVAVGPNSISLVNAQVDHQGGNRLFVSHGSLIRRDIPSGPATFVEIDLLEEMIRHQGRSTREAARTTP